MMRLVMLARFTAGLSLIVLLSTCDRSAPEPESVAELAAKTPSEQAIEAPTPDPPVPDPPAVLDATEPPEPTTSFDPATATAATVRIITIHSGGTGPCGIIHSTGAIEVEALGVGEPAPRMILIVSCPTDFYRNLLVVDTLVDVTLHAKRKSWPTPPIVRKLPPELPRRYVRSMSPTSAVPAPASQSSAAPE